ncbi:unnamed protein product [Durusdinium trenchii]|uniref:Uncharacterized protein n=1 Tax=Durusdinium trenchii TaxID=1381693 RepID=A0ABP0J7U4_9DINO
MPQEYERRMSADGSFLVRARAYDKPRGFKARVRKLLIVLRLLSLGRHRRRASCSIVARQSARKLADPLTEAEAEFLGKVLSFVPVMARTSKLMRPFLDEGDGSLHELAARTLHQAKVMTIRTVWKDLMEPLKEEMEKFKNRNVTLQDQFREARTEFLKEISTLRDEVRIRGDPEKALGDGHLKDVMFFFEPMKTLQPHELQYCLEVIKEKMKMIFEGNSDVTPTVNFGQVERLKELLISSEVTKHKETINQMSMEIVELERERRHLQRELAVASKGYRDVTFGAETANHASESALAELTAEAEQLRQEMQSVSEVASQREGELKNAAEQARVLLRERDNARKKMKISIEESKDLQERLAKADEEIACFSKELQETRRELQLLENRDMIMAEQLERQRVYGETVIKENEMLRKTMGRWQERRRSAPPCFDLEKVFLENELADTPQRARQSSEEAIDSSLGDSDAETNPIVEEVGDLIVKLRESDRELQDAISNHIKMSAYACDLELENKRLRQALEEQARYVVQHGADLELQHAECLAEMTQQLLPGKDRKQKECSSSGTSSAQHTNDDQNVDASGAINSGINHLHDELLSLATAGTEAHTDSENVGHASEESLGATAASAVERVQARLKKLRKLTNVLQRAPLDDRPEGEEGAQHSPRSSFIKTAKEAAVAAKELQEELNGMCEITARVAVALKCAVEESAQTREAVALLNDQVRMAEAALKSSPALEADEDLQRCLQKVTKLGRSALFGEVKGVFGRLWNDSLDRQKRRFLQKERREKIQSALQSAPVYVLDENPAERVGRPCSASRTQQTEETEAIEVSAKPSLSSAPAPLDPSNASTSPSAEDAHRRPSKTLLPSDLSLRHVSRRRASAPEVITRSWCLSDRPSNQSATASNLSPPSPTASLIIRQFSPSPSRLSDPQVDLAAVPHAPLQPKALPRSPRPLKARPALEDSPDENDPLAQARMRPRAVPPLSPSQSTGPNKSALAATSGAPQRERSFSKTRESQQPSHQSTDAKTGDNGPGIRTPAWHMVPDSNGHALGMHSEREREA